MNTKAQGYIGEEIAADYLKKLKYKILERNVKVGGVEVDIIARLDPTHRNLGHFGSKRLDLMHQNLRRLLSKRFGSEQLDSKNLGSKCFGSERLDSKNLGSKSCGSERLDSKSLGSKSVGTERRESVVYVFCEVKTRSSEIFGTPSEGMLREQRKRYVYAAKCYVNMHKLANTDIRFDIIEVKDGEINHIIGAFDAD